MKAIQIGLVVVSALFASSSAGAGITDTAQAAPTPLDFHWAMESSLPGAVAGTPVMLGHCIVARHVHCEPPSGDGLSRCRFDDEGRKEATLVKIGGVWKYKSGDRLRCEITTE